MLGGGFALNGQMKRAGLASSQGQMIIAVSGYDYFANHYKFMGKWGYKRIGEVYITPEELCERAGDWCVWKDDFRDDAWGYIEAGLYDVVMDQTGLKDYYLVQNILQYHEKYDALTEALKRYLVLHDRVFELKK